MRYYTKEWYELMQRQDYTACMKKIPDKAYTDREIRELYQKQLKREIASDRRAYNTPPFFLDVSEQLLPEHFDSEDWLFVDEESGECRQPETPDEVREQLERDRKEAGEEFANRPPFDPEETISRFKQCYRMNLRHAASRYPAWVGEQVDKRLLALSLLPECAYMRLKMEEKQNRKAFLQIEKAAEKELKRHSIPENIRKQFCFHDANVLSLKKSGSNYQMVLRKDGAWPKGTTPYERVIFTGAVLLEKDNGLVIRTHRDAENHLDSNCVYLYDELYTAQNGYEVHMLLHTKELQYLTVRCENIHFEDNIIL